MSSSLSRSNSTNSFRSDSFDGGVFDEDFDFDIGKNPTSATDSASSIHAASTAAAGKIQNEKVATSDRAISFKFHFFGREVALFKNEKNFSSLGNRMIRKAYNSAVQFFPKLSEVGVKFFSYNNSHNEEVLKCYEDISTHIKLGEYDAVSFLKLRLQALKMGKPELAEIYEELGKASLLENKNDEGHAARVENYQQIGAQAVAAVERLARLQSRRDEIKDKKNELHDVYSKAINATTNELHSYREQIRLIKNNKPEEKDLLKGQRAFAEEQRKASAQFQSFDLTRKLFGDDSKFEEFGKLKDELFEELRESPHPSQNQTAELAPSMPSAKRQKIEATIRSLVEEIKRINEIKILVTNKFREALSNGNRDDAEGLRQEVSACDQEIERLSKRVRFYGGEVDQFTFNPPVLNEEPDSDDEEETVSVDSAEHGSPRAVARDLSPAAGNRKINIEAAKKVAEARLAKAEAADSDDEADGEERIAAQ